MYIKRDFFSSGYTKVADLLIRSGANIEALDKDGSFPLYYAAMKGNLTEKYTIKENHYDQISMKYYKIDTLFRSMGNHLFASPKWSRR